MQERVQRSIEELGYRPRTGARGMRGQTFTIAIGSSVTQVGNDFFTQVTIGASRKLAGSGYQLIIAHSPELDGDEQVLNGLVDRQVDGIIAISLDVPAKTIERLSEYVPVVLIGRHDRSEHYDTVTNDDNSGVTQAMTHLLELGHRRIAHLTIRPVADLADSRPPHAIRRKTYEDTMVAHGLTPQVIFCDASEQTPYAETLAMLDLADPPTAILAGNDTAAIGALRAVSERGLTARDVSVVGYDNIQLASHPLVSLTTVDQYGELTGATAVELLMERITETRVEAKHVELEPILLVRNSTAAPATR
jgi:LacI family transcriptional regulator